MKGRLYLSEVICLSNVFSQVFDLGEKPCFLSIFDVGCGRGRYSPFLKPLSSKLVGCDIHSPSLEVCKYRNCYDELFNYDLRNPLPLPDRSFDVSVCFETLEHLSKEESLILLEELERITKRLVVVSTPTRFISQDKDKVFNNPYAQHRCLWSLRDFKTRGYKVRGLESRWSVGGAWLDFLCYRFPQLAKRFFAWKFLQ